MVSKRRSCVSQWSMPLARLHEARTGDGPDDSGTFLKALATNHVCSEYGRSQRRPQARPQFATHTACTAEFRTETTLFVDDSIDTLIDTLSTQAFAEDQIKDTHEHAHTSNLGRHGRANLQRTAISLMVTHLSLSTPLITTLHPLLPLSLKLLPITFHRLPRL